MTDTEKKAIELLTENFGKDLYLRVEKLKEEFNEFLEAFEEFKNGTGTLEHMIEELSDFNAVKTHISSIYGKSNDDLLIDAIVKVRIREKYPEYKREKNFVFEKNLDITGECMESNPRTNLDINHAL